MSYKSTHTGAQIDAGVSAALNPDATPTLSSTNLVTSGGVAAKLSEKQDTLVFDNAPTSGSNNPVKSSGIFNALAGKQNTLTFDDAPTDGSNNPVKSKGIYDALALKAPLDSPTFTGTPTAPTPTAGDNSTKVATTAFVAGEIATADAAQEQMILASFPTDSITNAAVASFSDGADGIPVKRMTVNITPVQAGSGDPSPDNVRPISGWTGANITVIGKNLFDVDNAAVYSRSINDSTLKYVTASSSKSYAVPCLPNTTYAVSCDNPNITIFRVCYIKDTSIPDSGSLDAYGIQTATASGSFTITTGADATYLIVQINSAVIAESAGKVQIEFGSAATEYAPYNSASAVHSVSWQTEAGTVYGGTLTDNGDGTWKLTATHGGHVFDGTENLFDSSSMLSRCANYNIQDMWIYSYGSSTRTEDLNCSHFKPSQTVLPSAERADHILPYTDGTSIVVGFGYSENVGADLTALKSYMAAQYANGTPVTVMFKLASAFDVHITAESVKTLLGQNNIFADCGDVASLTYRADIGLYIDKKLAEA